MCPDDAAATVNGHGQSHGWLRRPARGQGRAGQGRAGQGRAGQGRAGQGRAGQGRWSHSGGVVYALMLREYGDDVREPLA